MPLGRKTGGRKAGTPNKATVAMLRHPGLPAGYRRDVPLAKDILVDCMVRARAMVKLCEPKEGASAKHDKRRQSLYKQWLNIAAKFAAKLAQYKSPSLRAVYVKQLPCRKN